MELCSEVLHGLRVAGDTVKVPDKIFPRLISSVCASLLDLQNSNFSNDWESSSIDYANYKLVYSSLSTLLLEAAKHDTDISAIGLVLEDCKFAPDRISQVGTTFETHKDKLRAVLSQIGTSPAHIVDVNWRLDYYLKNSQVEKVNQPVYLINLKTENSTAEAQDVQLACSLDQLQDLVGKLRDACKSLERSAQL